MKKIGQRASSESLLRDYSLTEQLPIMSGFPFAEIHSSLDVHSIFMVEPLHQFHSGISKDLKRCASERLRSEIIFTTSLPSKSNIKRRTTIKNVRMTILNGLNKMLAHIQKTSPMNGLRVDFAGRDKGDYGNGLFNSEGNLMGMLEANDYRSLDMVSPFMGMLFDQCSDKMETAPTTGVFVEYVDIMQTALSYDNKTTWTMNRIHLMEKSIKKFKTDARTLYQDYHPSGLCTEKMHMLGHIPYDLKRAGGLRYGDSGLYEYSPTLLKKPIELDSKEKPTLWMKLYIYFKRTSITTD